MVVELPREHARARRGRRSSPADPVPAVALGPRASGARASTRLLGRRARRPGAVGAGSAAARCCSARRGRASACSTSAAGPGASWRRCATRAPTRSGWRSPRRRSSVRGRWRRAPTCGCSRTTARSRWSTGPSTSCGARRCSSTSPTARTCSRRPGACCGRAGGCCVTVPYHGRLQAALGRAGALRRALRPAGPAPAVLHARARSRLRCARPGSRRRDPRRGRACRCCGSRSWRARRALAAVGLHGARGDDEVRPGARVLRVEVVGDLEVLQRRAAAPRARRAGTGRAGATPRRWRAGPRWP